MAGQGVFHRLWKSSSGLGLKHDHGQMETSEARKARKDPKPPPKRRRARALPEALGDGPFTRAEAAGMGVHDAWIHQAKLHNPTRGIWCQDEPMHWRSRAVAHALALPPGSAYSHTTGAKIHDLPLPWRLEREDKDVPADLHVITPSSLTQRRRPGWIGHTGAERRQVVVVDGLPVTGLIDTWIDLGSMAVGRRRALTIEDLVVAGDELINKLIATGAAGSHRSRLGHAQRHLDPEVVGPVLVLIRARLAERVRPRLRGRTALEAALPLMRAGVKSPQETRTRLMFARAGFPEPLVNANIHVEGGGGWLGEGDLVWKEAKTVAEYQSEHHADRKRRSFDSDKLALFRDEGWHTHEVWAEDLRPGVRQHALLERVGASLHRQRLV